MQLDVEPIFGHGMQDNIWKFRTLLFTIAIPDFSACSPAEEERRADVLRFQPIQIISALSTSQLRNIVYYIVQH
jgi:hypothetical protein